MATEHHFNIADAQQYGVDAAILLHNLKFWLEKNLANKHNIHDGRVWTYNTQNAWVALFPYFTRRQIQRILKTLVEAGLLLKGNYNEDRFDKTVWYSLNLPEFEVNPPQTRETPECTKRCTRVHETVPSTAPNGALLTDNKQTDKKKKKSNARAENPPMEPELIPLALFVQMVLQEATALGEHDYLSVDAMQRFEMKIGEYATRYPNRLQAYNIHNCIAYAKKYLA